MQISWKECIMNSNCILCTLFLIWPIRSMASSQTCWSLCETCFQGFTNFLRSEVKRVKWIKQPCTHECRWFIWVHLDLLVSDHQPSSWRFMLSCILTGLSSSLSPAELIQLLEWACYLEQVCLGSVWMKLWYDVKIMPEQGLDFRFKIVHGLSSQSQTTALCNVDAKKNKTHKIL